MTDLYFALFQGRSVLERLEEMDWEKRQPCILISFYYLAGFEKTLSRINPRRKMLDSGAYSAYTAKVVVDRDALARETMNPRWDECVGLDVIGDWKGSKENADYLARLGSPAMPVFHIGDPLSLLDYYCSRWPKVGLSCRFGESEKESMRFYDKCYARRWPHRFHSFGDTAMKVLRRYPFHSADSTWLQGMAKFATIRSIGHRLHGMTTHEICAYLPGEIDFFLERERELKFRWRREMEQLEQLPMEIR